MFLEGSGELAHLRLMKTWLGDIYGVNITEGAKLPKCCWTVFTTLLHFRLPSLPAYIALYAFFKNYFFLIVSDVFSFILIFYPVIFQLTF